MGYKIKRYTGSSWDDVLVDSNIDITDPNSNFTGTDLSTVLDELHDGGTYLHVSGGGTVSENETYTVDTSSGGFTLTMPSTPSSGDEVRFIPASNWGTNNFSVAGGGSNIQGQNTTLLVDTDYGFSLTYQNSSFGWGLS